MWAVSRAFFFIVGALGHAFIGEAIVAGGDPAEPSTLDYWGHWDGRWFAQIAADGYDSVAATAFFPLYPLTIRAGLEVGLAAGVAGVFVSCLATLFALYFIYGLGRSWHGERAALVAILLTAFFPTAFFLNAVYSDALFLALTAGSVWAVYVRRDLLLAGVFAYFAAATRNVGALLILPIAYEWLAGTHVRAPVWKAAVAVCAPLAGIGSYMLYLQLAKGEPLLFLTAYEENWGRGFASPIEKIWSAARHSAEGLEYFWPERMFSTASAIPAYLLSNTLNLWFLLFAMCAFVLAVRRVPVGALLFAGATAFGPLFRDPSGLPLNSYSRYVLVVFPLFLAVGAALATRRRATVTWVLASSVLASYLTLMFVTWRWVA